MNAEFIFCPRCGAITKPGICTNCGYNTLKTEETSNYGNDDMSQSNSSNDFSSSDNSTYSSNDNSNGFSNPDSNGSSNTASVDNGAENYNYTSAEYSGNPYVTKKKNSSSKGWIIGLIIGIILIILIFIIGLLSIIGLTVLVMVPMANSFNNINTATTNPITAPTSPSTTTPSISPDDIDGPDVEDFLSDDDQYNPTITNKDTNYSNFDADKFEEYKADANEYLDSYSSDGSDYFENGMYGDYLASDEDHTFYPRDSFDTPYNPGIVNSYVENEHYTLERHNIRYEGESDGVYVNAYCAYYEIVSDEGDFTDVNEKLKQCAVNELYSYLNETKHNSSTYSYNIYTDCIVTYNDDDIISCVYNTTSYEGENLDMMYIHGANVDVKNAQLMENTKIVNCDDDFSKFFVERSNTQNRYVESINNSDVSDVTKVLNDEDSLIVFFTPLGLEIGINYRYYYYSGWVTITINDFAQYLTGNYDFNTDFAIDNGYDMYQYEKDNNITPYVPGYTPDEDEDLYDF